MPTQHHTRPARDAPRVRLNPMESKRSIVWAGDWNSSSDLSCRGYTSLADNPEIRAAVDKLASLVASMPIHLMRNGELGNTRVINELSRKVDINPNKYMTRTMLVAWIVRTMLLEGDGNAVILPRTENGILVSLDPVPAAQVAFLPRGTWEYTVSIMGKQYLPEDVLHFPLNPGTYYPWLGEGYQVSLSNVAHNLKQAAETERGFMSSEYKPSMIVKVDAVGTSFQNDEGRKKLLDDYIATSRAGEPWVIPAEQISVDQVKPLSLKDLALADHIKLDKRTVAAILDIPPFVVGEGEFRKDEWNNFIGTRIMHLAQIIEQVMTKQLLYAPDLFFRFSARALYNYSLSEINSVCAAMADHLALDRNEWREWVGFQPRADMTELLALENYIPADRLGDQKKLNGGDE